MCLYTVITGNNMTEEEIFTTIRIRKSDGDRLEKYKVHEKQPIHEIITELIDNIPHEGIVKMEVE